MRRRALVPVAALLGAVTLVAACGSDSGTQKAEGTLSPSKPVTIRLLTHDSFAASKSVLADFTRRTGVTVKLVKAGDAGAMLNQAILTKGKPLGDVLFGVDNTFLSRALDKDLFEPYTAARLDEVPKEYQLDDRHRVTPIDHGEVCINYDKKKYGASLPAPRTFDDLVDPRYKNQLVVESPATSSPGLAFLLATVKRYGADGWQDYWRKLKANGVKVSAGWEDAYNGQFSGGSGKGDRPLVVSYASSPPAEVYYADPQPADAPIGVVDDTCFRQIEFAGVLKGTSHEAAARAFVDFLLSKEFQEDVPLQMFVFPVARDAALPDVFTKFAVQPAHPLELSANEIGKNRERWIKEWTSILG